MFLSKLLTMKNWGYWHHLKVFVLDMPFLKLVNMPLLMKGKSKFATCEHQIYIIYNSSLYNMAKKLGKGRVELKKTCLIASLQPQKLFTPMKTSLHPK